MLAALGTYLVVALAVLAASVIIIAIGVIYRIREQIFRALSFISLGLAFALAFLFQNSVTEALLVRHGVPYTIVKAWDVSLISAFKGPLVEATVPEGAWVGSHGLILGVAFFILVTAVVTSYLSAQLFGLSEKVAAAVAAVFAVIALLGLVWTHQAHSMYLQGANLDDVFTVRDRANVFKLVAVVVPFLMMAIGSFQIYRETGTKVYILYGVAILVGVAGFTILGTTWFKGWEDYVVKTLAPEGNLAPAYARFTFSAILMVIAALGVLIGNILEAVPPAEEAEEELEEFEEVEEGFEEEAGEEAG